MKTDKTSRTAQYMALFRALETERDANDKLFSDHYAIHFLEAKLRFAAECLSIQLSENIFVIQFKRKSREHCPQE